MANKIGLQVLRTSAVNGEVRTLGLHSLHQRPGILFLCPLVDEFQHCRGLADPCDGLLHDELHARGCERDDIMLAVLPRQSPALRVEEVGDSGPP